MAFTKKSFSTFLLLCSLITVPTQSFAEDNHVEPHSSLEWFELMQDWLDTQIDETTIELHEEIDKTLEASEEAKKELKKEIAKNKKKNEEKRAKRLKKLEEK